MSFLPPQIVNVLRSQLAQLEEVKKERETLEGEIKAVTFDMSVTFLTALAQDGAINEEQLSLTQLDKLYGSYNERVQASLRSQEELLGQVQVQPGFKEAMQTRVAAFFDPLNYFDKIVLTMWHSSRFLIRSSAA